MKNLKNNIYFKIGVITIIVLFLLIPTSMIKRLIKLREATQKAAISEVSEKWANNQIVSGPYLSIPYYRYIKQVSTKDSTEKLVAVKEYLHILPDYLQITGDLSPEKRTRGIYEIVVYESNLQLKGFFKQLHLQALDIKPENILFDKAEIVLGINDLRGIKNVISIDCNKNNYAFNPAVSSVDIIKSGVSANVAIENQDDSQYDFNINISLKGSQQLFFTPVGKVTEVTINSNWANPSFNGAFLPENRLVNDTGFSANWKVLHLNRNFPQYWVQNRYNPNNFNFGIDLILPVDRYLKSYRSIEYAFMFIFFTFLVFFFIEVLNKIFIHPIQYILVGVALVVFYTLLLSISEHINYNLSFLISALATLLLIAGYIKAILKSTNLTLLITGILTILYAFIFIIIQLQDYALLIGSIGIFIILGLVMYFSRKIDWYKITLKEEK